MRVGSIPTPPATHCINCGKKTWALMAAEKLADEVEKLVREHKLDARSPAADALLEYRDPFEKEG